jgi:ABC-type transport system involved in cytochrome bd biosynthesis fused ATPase/permease subunit
VALLVLVPLALGDVLADLTDAVGSFARSRASSARLASLLEQRPAVRDLDAARGAGAAQDAAAQDAAAQDEAVETAGAETAVDDIGGEDAAPRIELRGLTARWDADQGTPASDPDVGPVDLVIEPGERLAVVGPSGCGKSTLLAVLARHLDPEHGAFRAGDHDVRDLAVARVRAMMAVMDDEPHVFASTVRENLRLANPHAQDAELVEALDCAGLVAWLRGLSDGLDTRLGTAGRGLSGGEIARLSLARALLSGRPVLLLDEPVAHLDHPTAAAVVRDLLAATRGRTVVLVSHRLDVLDGFDRVLDLGRRPGVRPAAGAGLASAPAGRFAS